MPSSYKSCEVTGGLIEDLFIDFFSADTTKEPQKGARDSVPFFKASTCEVPSGDICLWQDSYKTEPLVTTTNGSWSGFLSVFLFYNYVCIPWVEQALRFCHPPPGRVFNGPCSLT